LLEEMLMNVAADDPWKGCNPLEPGFRDDPYPALHRLRANDPVNLTPIGIWRLSRYADVVRLLREANAGVRTTDGRLPFVDESELERQREFMLQHDPPKHTRLRKLVSRAFTPRAVERLRPKIAAVADRCLDRVAERGEMDIVADLALPVPSTLICEMMGVPLSDRERFTRWTAEATHGLAAGMAPQDVLDRARDAGMALADYFEKLIAERRANLRDDILSGLIRAHEEGDRLSPTELISQAIGLLIAGFETTIGLIANGARAFVRHPEQIAALRADPGLIVGAVDECLRYDSPIPLTPRVLHEDTEFGGVTIPQNAIVWGLLSAANRDPARFPDPDRFDIARRDNEHLAFGGGAHFCLGAHLAHLEGELALGALFSRFRDFELTTDQIEWGPSLFRVPGRLPVRFRV
jgi:cytochrome P450